MKDIHQEKVIILDFGSQYTQLIARRVREGHVYCEIVPYNHSITDSDREHLKGIILSGGPSSVYQDEAPLCDASVFDMGVPVLGICYGMQATSRLLGGEVAQAEKREFGRAILTIDDNKSIFSGIDSGKLEVWMSHGDRIEALPKGFKTIAHTADSPYAAISDETGRIFGLQFHPEVDHTKRGADILQNFLYKVCGCSPSWTMASFAQFAIAKARLEAGEGKILCGLSGGVDSSVAAMLLHKAVGERLTCLFINNGLLRKNEADDVIKMYRDQFHLNVVYVDASERFLTKLAGVVDPEEKRKIIGGEFIAVFDEESKKLGEFEFLAQGTLYPDVIESVSVRGPSATIKSHHNVGGLPKDMRFKLIEPLRELFKDEVRALGKELGLTDEIVWRHPFPGPGLAVRILGEITPERLNVLREADHIFISKLKETGVYHDVWQAFAVLLPIKTVGVMGDERSYENVVALRAVTSRDGMTADWGQIPYDLLGDVSSRIINEVRGINRVVYDISSKPPATIEWE